MDIESIFSDVLEKTENLCDPVRFGLMLEIFSQMDLNGRESTIAGLQAYVNAERKDLAARPATH